MRSLTAFVSVVSCYSTAACFETNVSSISVVCCCSIFSVAHAVAIAVMLSMSLLLLRADALLDLVRVLVQHLAERLWVLLLEELAEVRLFDLLADRGRGSGQVA